jgi:hypothetical protein
MSENLKLCPFCGIYPKTFIDGDNKECATCCGGIVLCIKAWNTRALPSNGMVGKEENDCEKWLRERHPGFCKCGSKIEDHSRSINGVDVCKKCFHDATKHIKFGDAHKGGSSSVGKECQHEWVIINGGTHCKKCHVAQTIPCSSDATKEGSKCLHDWVWSNNSRGFYCQNCNDWSYLGDSGAASQDVDIEELSAEIHKCYCRTYEKNHGKPYWTNGDYSKLDEPTKDYDREMARWHIAKLSAKPELVSENEWFQIWERIIDTHIEYFQKNNIPMNQAGGIYHMKCINEGYAKLYGIPKDRDNK